MLSLKNTFKSTSIIIVLLLASSTNQIQSQTKIGTKAPWITNIMADTSFEKPTADSYGGHYFLLVDVQENINEETIFYHYIIKLLNNTGVQNMSDISLDYDPEFQSLVLHEINRYRDGIKTNELANHEVKTIQREQEMNRFLYDGRLTSYVNLKDVREGDIIEYSYSLKGYNPINQGNYFRTFNLEYSDPVKMIYRRIIAAKNIELFFNYPAGAAEPVVQEIENNNEYIWQVKESQARIYDNNVPSWYNDNRRVEISTIDKWIDLVNLCISEYKISSVERENLEKDAAILFEGQSSDSLIVSIIRFVQDKIRYLGFESGLNAFRPIPPSTVLMSRFADCKAKSLLLCSLLSLYGIKAYPVLVNSIPIKSELRILPSSELFNHVIVQIHYKNKIIYIDPTLSNQGGDLNNTYFPNYGYGLVLNDKSSSLTYLSNNSNSETRVSNYFKVDTIGEAASLKVISKYTGFYADDLRSSYQNNSIEEITNNYLKFYSNSYPHIKSNGLLKFKDNRDENIFTVEEDYQIDSIWIPLEGTVNKIKMSTGALIINYAASIPTSPDREMPYLISYPSKLTEDIYIDLPREWNISPQKIEIRDSVFSFIYTSDYKDKIIHLHYNYSTYNDHLAANKFKDFYSQHKKITDYILYSLTYSRNNLESFKFSWNVAFLYLIIVTISIIIFTKIYKTYNLPTTTLVNQEIGGWLILIAFGLIISTFKIAYGLYFDDSFFNQETWSNIKDSTNKTSLFFLISFEFIYNSVLLVYLVFLQILFFKKRNILPRLVIIFYLVNVIVLTLDTFLALLITPSSFSVEQKNKSYLEIVQATVYTIIWTTYFIKSSRVKNTFVNVYSPNSSKHLL